MKGFTDLQIQTHFSDGQLSPSAVVRLARSYGITTLAITDHDSVAGVAEAKRAGRRFGVRIIPGVELYARFRGHEVHILGYNINLRNRKLLSALAAIQIQHRRWLARICSALQRSGWRIEMKDFSRSRSELVGFREILDVLESHRKNGQRLRHEFGTTTPDLFSVINTLFLGKGAAALPVPKKKLPARQALRLLRGAGGHPVLAHPGQQLQFTDDGLIAALRRMGLQGVEAITPHHTWHQMLHYQLLARKLRLFVTAGSDFHELLGQHYVTRTRWDVFRVSQHPLPWESRR